MAFSATYFSNSKTESNFRLINILVMHKKVKTIILSVHLINIDSHLTRKKKRKKIVIFLPLQHYKKKNYMYRRNRLWERWDFPGNLQLCKIHFKTSNENLAVLRRTMEQQGQIQSHNDTHGNIKNTRTCIMQVLVIKELCKELYCCNWEKRQPFCKKKISSSF